MKTIDQILAIVRRVEEELLSATEPSKTQRYAIQYTCESIINELKKELK